MEARRLGLAIVTTSVLDVAFDLGCDVWVGKFKSRPLLVLPWQPSLALTSKILAMDSTNLTDPFAKFSDPTPFLFL